MPINRRPTPPPEAIKMPNTVMDSLNAWTDTTEDEDLVEKKKKKKIPLGYAPLRASTRDSGSAGSDEPVEPAGWEKLFDSESDNFNTGIGIVILLNAIVIGLETDMGHEHFIVFEHIFNACFVLEMITRILQIGGEYFTSPWYLFDCSLVIAGSLDLWILPAVYHGREGGGAGSTTAEVGHQLSVIRLLRILRLMRVLRVVRLFRMFNNLLLICKAFGKAIQVVLLLSVLVVIMIYALAIVVTQLVGHSADKWGDHKDDINFWFGDIQASMCTLFFVMFGSGWDPLMELLKQVYPEFTILIFFAGYMVVVVALAALIIGLISESLIVAQQEFKQRKLEQFASKKKVLAAEYTEELITLLEDDMDELGTVDTISLKAIVKGDVTLTQKLMGVGVSLGADGLAGLVDSLSNGGKLRVNVDHYVDKLMNLSGSSTASAVVDVRYDIIKNKQKMDAVEAKLDMLLKKM